MLNLGVLAELLLVFLVSVEVVLIVPVRVLSATCAVEVTCLLQPRFTAVGIVGSMLPKNVTPWCPPLLLLESQLS